MKRKFVAANPEKCTGCGICVLVCSFKKEKVFNPFKARIRIVRLHPLINLAVTCRLCEDAPCVAACPRNSLEQSEETGVILVNEDKCDGCGWCIEACDYGVITLHPKKRAAIVCDLCNGEPECVEWCPKEALDLVTQDTLDQIFRESVTKEWFLDGWKNIVRKR